MLLGGSSLPSGVGALFDVFRGKVRSSCFGFDWLPDSGTSGGSEVGVFDGKDGAVVLLVLFCGVPVWSEDGCVPG